MNDVRPQDVFISAAANRSSHVADWASIGAAGGDDERGSAITVLAYGSHRSIALAYDFGEQHSLSRGVSELLPTPFTSPVTTLKYIRPAASTTRHRLILVAGAGNGQAAVWIGQHASSATSASETSSTGSLWKPLTWTLAATLKPTQETNHAPHQKGTVQAIGVSSATGDSSTIAIGTSDGTITIWALLLSSPSEVQAHLAQVIHSDKQGLAGALPLDIAFANLSSDSSSAASSPLLMTTASTDRKIVFWLKNPGHEATFTKILVLSGHDDWVRSLDFSAPFSMQSADTSASSTQLELASGSQDGSVRLWRLRPHTVETADSAPATAIDAFDRLAKQVEDEANQNNDASGGASLSNKTHIINTWHGQWAVTFDALLTGHEAWVSGVRWHPPIIDGSHTDQPAALLSASVDNSIIFWTPSGLTSTSNGRLTYPSLSAKEATSSLWLPAQRFGELGVAGAGALGMFGALWNPEWHTSPARQLVTSHAWAGAVHLWAFDNDKWTSRTAITGHHLPVKSARWSPNGDWFLTASLDRTARLFGEHNRKADYTSLTTWHELARPQTHGYDIMSASWLDDLAFASAADEKVSRIFAAPQTFVQSAKRLGAVRSEREGSAIAQTHNVLSIHLPSATEAKSILALQPVIAEAARQTCRSKHTHLYIVLSSPLFNGFASNTGGIALSFKDTEALLTSCYGFAWAEIVKEGNLLADVDVLLSGDAPLQQTLHRLGTVGSGVEHLWALDASSPFACPALERPTSGLHVEYLSASPLDAGSDAAASTSRDTFPQHTSIAMGGTFDHLHVGHKILLSMAALICTRRITVGVTGDSMLAKKSNRQLLETVEERLAAVNNFLHTFRSTSTPLEHNVVELKDVCGPTGSDPDLEALLVTDETLSGAETIAKTRSERGLSTLVQYTIGVVGASGETNVKGNASELAAAKIGSTAIREWLSKQSLAVQAKARRRVRQSRIAQWKSDQATRPMAASVPALGLSNRAVFDGQGPETEVNELGREVEAPITASGSVLSSGSDVRPPVEEEFLVSTLWPELDKLYGHGYELLASDSSPDGGRLTATSCKSTSSEHAVVRVYDRSNNWKEVGVLSGHSLTITRIRFSPDSRWILTVSRDRSWRLFRRRNSEDGQSVLSLTPFTHKEAAHARIIWDAAWSDDSRMFATASRDKCVKVWRLPAIGGEQEEVVKVLASVAKLPDAATAVAFDERNRLAVGLENGCVIVFELVMAQEQGELRKVVELPRHHATAVNELGWRPLAGDDEEDDTKGLLLSAGEDGAVRLVRV